MFMWSVAVTERGCSSVTYNVCLLGAVDAGVYLDVRREGGYAELEANLVGALSSGSVADEGSIVVDGRLDNA